MTIHIPHRLTGETIYTYDGDSLAGADLTNADLTRADLTNANLFMAHLSRVDLTRANLTDANLFMADLTDANLRGADLTCTKLTGVELSGANLADCVGLPDAPSVPDIKAKILGAGKINMAYWHTCETTHCLAGWAVHLAGDAGSALEEQLGASAAGALIFHASIGEVPDFYSSDEEAIEWLRKDTTP